MNETTESNAPIIRRPSYTMGSLMILMTVVAVLCGFLPAVWHAGQDDLQGFLSSSFWMGILGAVIGVMVGRRHFFTPSGELVGALFGTLTGAVVGPMLAFGTEMRGTVLAVSFGGSALLIAISCTVQPNGRKREDGEVLRPLGYLTATEQKQDSDDEDLP